MFHDMSLQFLAGNWAQRGCYPSGICRHELAMVSDREFVRQSTLKSNTLWSNVPIINNPNPKSTVLFDMPLLFKLNL